MAEEAVTEILTPKEMGKVLDYLVDERLSQTAEEIKGTIDALAEALRKRALGPGGGHLLSCAKFHGSSGSTWPSDCTCGLYEIERVAAWLEGR